MARTGHPKLWDERPSPPSVAVSTTDAKLDQILRVIMTSKQVLSAIVDAVVVEIGLLKADQQKLSSRVTHVESDVAEICLTDQELEGQCRSADEAGHVAAQEPQSKGLHLLEQARADQAQAFATAVTIWADRRLPQDSSPDKDAA
ncbi:hypothetical protein NDU88_005356 [Pleurodeles waltl]|uniref:Uncharacterized protein n=1 Tax=Pleurodeles waltl TaxID=8319 RepID=A0AAV7QI33_PLEWA|nr:hypothetical protein NDU88_005356 [Pleurodeles waltl]